MSFDEFAARAPKKRKGIRGAKRSEVEAALEEATLMREAGSWKDARPRHFVAYYVQLHTHVYKIPPDELRGKEWTAACLAASRMLARDFSGDAERMARFVYWTWSREKKSHLRSGDVERRRLGWRLQFSAAFVTDYRLHLSRQHERSPNAQATR